jgi:hypothetical protein
VGDNELLVKIGADVSALKAALVKGQKDVKDFAATFHDIQGGIQAAISNVQRLVGAVQSFISPALEAEKSVSELTAALRAQGVSSTKVRDEILKYSTALQRQSTYGDEAITEVQKLLFQLGRLEGEGLRTATKATLDLAAGLGIDLHSAAMMVAKAAAGNTTTLGRYGIQITKTGDQAKDFAAVLEQLQGKFGGAAQAATQTAGGAFAQFKEATGDLVEIIGSKLLPSLATAAQYWRDVAYAATDAASANGDATNLAETDAKLLTSAIAKLTQQKNQQLQAQDFLTKAEIEAIKGTGAQINAWKQTGATLQTIIPQLERAAAINRETAVQANAAAAAEEKASIARKTSGMSADELTAFLANLDHAGDQVAVQLAILSAREKELRAEMDKLAKAGERVPKAMADEAAALRENIETLERARAREQALARVKDQAEKQDTERAETLEKEAELRRLLAIQLAHEAAERKKNDEQVAAANLELEKQRMVMQASTSVASALGDAFMGIAVEGKDAADTLRSVFRQLAMDIVRQAIAMIVAKAGEAAAKTIAANAGVPGPAGIALAVGGGAAIFAATVAYKDGIPGFARGGVVDEGPRGRDQVLARLTRGEEVLTRNDPRHVSNLGGATSPAPQKVTVNLSMSFNSVFPPDRTQLEVTLRDEVAPVLKRLLRNNLV